MAVFNICETLKDTCNAGVFLGPGNFFVKKSSIYFSLDTGRKVFYWLV